MDIKINNKKFLLMSRGFKGKGLNLKVSHRKDFPNFLEAVAGDGDAAVDCGQNLRTTPQKVGFNRGP